MADRLLLTVVTLVGAGGLHGPLSGFGGGGGGGGVVHGFVFQPPVRTDLRLMSKTTAGKEQRKDLAVLDEPPPAAKMPAATVASGLISGHLTTPAAGQQKRVYLLSEGHKDMKDVLGGKGANLCEMSKLGLPVPPAFVIATSCCSDYFKHIKAQGKTGLPAGLKDEYLPALADIEKKMGKSFGDPNNALLVSVRSGARASMPGMLDTVLNLGMNEQVAQGMLDGNVGSPRFVYDTYRRFIQMFSTVVMDLSSEPFEQVIDARKTARGVKLDVEMEADDWKHVVEQFLLLNPNMPSDAHQQLEMAIEAVFKSWFNPRAMTYRSMYGIPSDWGTAVNIQAMVFGNMNDQSGTGVAFSRDPSTGERVFFGEFLSNAAGEDVVAGIRTPLPLSQMAETWPEAYAELDKIQTNLETFYKDMQDMEFTIENGRLFMLQTRDGKRTPRAAVKIACDLVDEGKLSPNEALLRIPADQVDYLLLPSIDPDAPKTCIATGLPASPGAVTGEIVFTPKHAEEAAAAGKKVILVRKETTPEDINGMSSAEGVLTSLGGMTSHAAVVARGMGRCCITGADIKVDAKAGTFTTQDGKVFHEGQVITLDGSTGQAFDGSVARLPARADDDFERVLGWADDVRTTKVFANADTPTNAQDARRLGAEGIGLCRTEHMFFDPSRITEMRAMILSGEEQGEKEVHLDRMFEFQRDDLRAMMKEMDGLPVTVRLLDPPLHEFLPHSDNDFVALAKAIGKSEEDIRVLASSMEEVNPMLGFRGCRLGVVFPEITLMQVKAIVTAAVQLKQEGLDPRPSIMVPVVSLSSELELLLPQCEAMAVKVMAEHGVHVPIAFGTMLELPRACLLADSIASTGVSFISFGTNDLTQSTFGFSRDDVGRFMPAYLDKGLVDVDPFVSLDTEGVGALIDTAVTKARSTTPDITIGICGEHGGDPASIHFFHGQKMAYVSCSPFRVPTARIAAGQIAASEAILAEERAAKNREMRDLARKYEF